MAKRRRNYPDQINEPVTALTAAALRVFGGGRVCINQRPFSCPHCGYRKVTKVTWPDRSYWGCSSCGREIPPKKVD